MNDSAQLVMMNNEYVQNVNLNNTNTMNYNKKNVLNENIRNNLQIKMNYCVHKCPINNECFNITFIIIKIT